jgi:hypothetical protein
VDVHRDSGMIVQSGPSDAPFDVRSNILAEINGIARRHVVPDLPDADYSRSDIAQWKAWLEKYKGQHLSKPVFENVSDPYLQCLTRRVEWGHPDAILDIATFGGPSAEAFLKQFPAPKSGEVMGARELFPDLLRNEDGHPDPDSEIQENLQAGLLRFGDQTTAGQVATELNSFAAYPGFSGGPRSRNGVRSCAMSLLAPDHRVAWTVCVSYGPFCIRIMSRAGRWSKLKGVYDPE